MIAGGLAGGGFAAWAYLQAHPCADFFHDPAFQQAVGAGMLAGVAGGAGGYLAGIILVAMIPETTLVGAIVVGMGSGSAGGGVTQVASNVLTGRALDEGLGIALISGGVTGGVGGALGRAVGQAARPGVRAQSPTVNPNNQTNVEEFLTEVARRAEGKIGGIGGAAGSSKHAYAGKLIERYQKIFGNVGEGLSTEVSYAPEVGVVGYGERGTVRLDVVVGDRRAPTAIYDFKFGSATLRNSRISKIRAVTGFEDVPIVPIYWPPRR